MPPKPWVRRQKHGQHKYSNTHDAWPSWHVCVLNNHSYTQVEVTNASPQGADIELIIFIGESTELPDVVQLPLLWLRLRTLSPRLKGSCPTMQTNFLQFTYIVTLLLTTMSRNLQEHVKAVPIVVANFNLPSIPVNFHIYNVNILPVQSWFKVIILYDIC